MAGLFTLRCLSQGLSRRFTTISSGALAQTVKACPAQRHSLTSNWPRRAFWTGVVAFGLAPGTARADGKPSVVFVLGAPGSGKGTQCAKIVEVG